MKSIPVRKRFSTPCYLFTGGGQWMVLCPGTTGYGQLAVFALGLFVQPVEEKAMNISRRDFAVASAFALGASGLLSSGSAEAQAADEAAVTQNIETLRKAILEADKAKLEQVTAAQISYGHSDGRSETKEQFINGVMTRKQVQKSLAFPELKVGRGRQCGRRAPHLPG
jgi:hypothetical protein